MIKVVYHADCQDGFGAAYAAWKALGTDGVEYIPAAYGSKPPAVAANDELYILDFSYPRQTLLDLEKHVAKIKVLDHHIAAEKELQGIPFCHFDVNESGALQAWKHFHPCEAVPEFIKRLDDRDRWIFSVPGSREQFAVLASHPYDFETWDRLAQNPSRIVIEGESLLRADAQAVERACETAVPVQLTDASGVVRNGHAVNRGELRSEIGHRLLELHPHDDFAATFWLVGPKLDRVRWSVRARENGFDVNTITGPLAVHGHKAAGGATESLEQFMRLHSQRFS